MSADVDIDFADRSLVLEHIRHVPARKMHKDRPERHASGVYVQPIPYDPALDCAALHYETADERGYFKLDLLNVGVYKELRSQGDYDRLLNTEPPWERLQEAEFVKKIIHIANYPTEIAQAGVDTIPRMAMFLAAIRPAKRHLLGKPWDEVAKTIWDPVPGEYTFKKAHAVSYAVLVGLHMNIVNEE